MTSLERSELEASPLADLHAIADQLGLDGFRRLRKADLIDAILATSGGGSPPAAKDASASAGANGESETQTGWRRRRAPRSRRPRVLRDEREGDREDDQEPSPAPPEAEGEPKERAPSTSDGDERVAEGVVELLENGSAFLRVDPPEPSDEDVYISAAQVRRCELVSGDRVAGPARRPRRSERYPSLIRVETINGAPAASLSEGPRYEDLPVAYVSQRLPLGAEDEMLREIELIAPVGRGSRAVIVGSRGAGKTEALLAISRALAGTDDLELTLLLIGVRPEELTDAKEGPLPPSAALTFAASVEAQSQAVERTLETAKRVAARGADAVVLIDTLDGLPPAVVRRALVSARNLREGGSVTVIATASRPFGGESTVIALDAALRGTGRRPALDLTASVTLRPELLVGGDGAEAITRARAAAARG